MQAMILAAGRGERMRPLTDHRPKPLLTVGDRPLIVHLIEQLARAGIVDLVINHCWLGGQLEAELGDGRPWGVAIRYSAEAVALETAGGLAYARPLLDDRPFLAVNGDIFTDFDFTLTLAWTERIIRENLLGVGLLVPNPAHHPAGDFSLAAGLVRNEPPHDLTWAGICMLAPSILDPVVAGRAAPLAPLLRMAAGQGRLGGVRHHGHWSDVGTPERLQALNAH